MDDPALPLTDHLLALRGLERINRFSRCARTLTPHVLAAARGRTHLALLDVATGSADVPVAIALAAARRGLRIRLGLCDISRPALDAAHARAAAAGIHATTHLLDATTTPLPAGFDAAICSLFLHHLTADAVRALLANIARAAPALAISDLRRTRRGLALAYAGSRLLSRSHIVRTDAVLSARAAWTIPELHALAAEAGLRGASITPAWPCRMLMTWSAP